MPKISRCSFAALLVTVLIAGCNPTPSSSEKREELTNDATATVKNMQLADPSLKDFLDKSYGYAIFPSVGKGGLIVGGSYGKAEVYENRMMIGWADLKQATVGLQAGGQSFSELLVFQNQEALNKFKRNELAFAANASAVAIKTGAGATAKYDNGVAVFTKPEAGLMFEASIGGQKFTFTAKP